MNLTVGDTFYGTHADLLNTLGLKTKNGETFKQYYKGTYELDSDTYIWIISIDGKEHSGWRNYLQGEDTVVECNLENYDHPIGLTHSFRVVFDKQRLGSGNKFVFMGYFKLQPESTNRKRVLRKLDGAYSFRG
jgi:hypothetical protein